jgi:ribonucleotide monophosphatase NagD (HAD superfamily)
MTDPLASIRCFLLDMDGTFFLGEHLVEGALRFIDTVKAQGRDFIFLTNNSSKNSRLYAEKICRLGLEIPESKVFTSGEATARYLVRTFPLIFNYGFANVTATVIPQRNCGGGSVRAILTV